MSDASPNHQSRLTLSLYTHLYLILKCVLQKYGVDDESAFFDPVPTVDTYPRDIGFDEQWEFLIKTYVAPVCEKIYEGYDSDVSDGRE